MSIGGGATRSFEILRVRGGDAESRADVAAAEEPLEIRLQGAPFVVTMRTPGSDHELAAGFLLAERIVDGQDDVLYMRHCRDTVDEGNVLDVMLTGAAATRATARLAERRHVVTTSACGVCGRQTIADLMEATPRVNGRTEVARAVIATLPERTQRQQAVFQRTGGLHAAALFATDGALDGFAEDVGRHNAVDKVIGSHLLAGRVPLHDRILFVSGRTSFEIVQKAVVAGIPIIASVSAPSSLAIELAREARATLIGFVRNGDFNVYAGKERIQF